MTGCTCLCLPYFYDLRMERSALKPIIVEFF